MNEDRYASCFGYKWLDLISAPRFFEQLESLALEVKALD